MTGQWRSRLTRLLSALTRRAAAADLDDEFETHLDLAAAEYRGVSTSGPFSSEARRLAGIRFGSRFAAREAVHEARGFPPLERAWTDLRYAARACGVRRASRWVPCWCWRSASASTSPSSRWANAVLFRGFAGLSDQDRLVYLTTGRDCCVSYQDVLDWRGAARSFDDIAAVADLRVAFDAGTGAETATATR